MTTRDIPQQFRAAQFTQSGGELELRETRMQDPRPEEVVIRVHASALNSTDQILRNDLLPGLEFPLTPGQAVVGEVVRQAQRGEGRVKEGSHVAALCYRGGCAEYVLADEWSVVELPQKLRQGDEMYMGPIFAWDMSRVVISHERCEEEHKHLGEHERKLIREHNERLGFKGDGCIVIYGEGGFVRLAIDSLRAEGVKRKMLVVTISDKWQAKDYGVKDDEMMRANDNNLREFLKKHGGAQGVICTDMPREGFEQLLDGCRYRSSMICLNPRKDDDMTVPIANLIAKSISIRGAPPLSHKDLERVMRLADKQSVRVPIHRYRFDQNEMREAWRKMEQREEFEAPVIAMEERQGGSMRI
ncbi:hypothetical protein NBRC10512_001165 [Rhodotorula toruloides]